MLMWARVVGFVRRRLDVTSWRPVSVLIFVRSQLVDVTEERISNRCLCWYAKVVCLQRKGRHSCILRFLSHSSHFSLSAFSLFSPFSSFLTPFPPILSRPLPFPSREWWLLRGPEGVSCSRSQRCCLSERTPSASRCPSRMFPSSCGASNPLPLVR